MSDGGAGDPEQPQLAGAKSLMVSAPLQRSKKKVSDPSPPVSKSLPSPDKIRSSPLSALKGVVAVAAVNGVVAGVADELVVRAGARETIAAGATEGILDVSQGIRVDFGTVGRAGAQIHDDPARGGFVTDGIVAAAAVQGIVAAGSAQQIVTVVAEKLVVGGRTDQGIVAGPADGVFDAVEGVVTDAGAGRDADAQIHQHVLGFVLIVDGVVAAGPLVLIVVDAATAEDQVVAGAAVNGVGAVAAGESVVSAASAQHVSARPSVEAVVTGMAPEGVFLRRRH